MPTIQEQRPRDGLAAFLVEGIDLNASPGPVPIEIEAPAGAKRASFVTRLTGGTWGTAVLAVAGSLPPFADLLKLPAETGQVRAGAAPSAFSAGDPLALIAGVCIPRANLYGATTVGLELTTAEGGAGTGAVYIEFHA